ncbi:MAG: LD-carboxypeptidase [candidate division Zixibacteria bacterium]|nr:LD-carboxypeptidase [candidate division Zixibacteria bacterium]
MARIAKPEALKKGDTIAVVAPASPAPQTALELGVRRLEEAGYKVHVFPQCTIKRGYLAGDDKSRAAALMKAFADNRYKAILCARGGFGCMRILKYLDLKLIKANPKIFVGYSDITVLHQAFLKAGFVTFHGAMPSIDLRRKNYKFNLDNLIKALNSSKPLGRVHNPKRLGEFKKYRGGQASGKLTGGNISLLTKLIGTEYMPSFKNKIVLLEDTDEESYRIDGYLAHLFEATDIAKARGFIFGEWVKVGITGRIRRNLTLDQVLNDYFGSLKVPILTNVACGHGKNVLTIPLGLRAFIDADKRIFEITERAVS